MNVDLSPLMKKTSGAIMDNLATLAARGAVVGVIGSVFLMHKADKKANDIIKKEQPSTIKEKIGLTWKYYIPVVTSTGITIGLILVSDEMWRNKYIALAGVYELTKKTYDDYRDEVKEEIGENKENDIYQKSTNKTLSNATIMNDFDERFITRCGWGNSLFVESSTGQIIIGNKESIKEVFNKLNHRMLSTNGEPEISLSDLCSEFNLRYVSNSAERGWNANYTGLIEPKFNAVMHINGDPDLAATVIDYYQEPKDNFGRDMYVV